MVCRIGVSAFLWRAVDDKGEFLDLVVQQRRDIAAALRLLNRVLRSQQTTPDTIVTDGLASYGAAIGQLGLGNLHHRGRLRDNNPAENSYLPIRRRERHMQLFKSRQSVQRFLTAHAAIYNTFYTQRHLISRTSLRFFRSDANAVWNVATA